MGFFKKKYKNEQSINANKLEIDAVSLKDTLATFKDCDDLTQNTIPQYQLHYLYFENLVNEIKVKEFLVDPFDVNKSPEVEQILAQERYTEIKDKNILYQGLLSGEAAIFHKDKAYLVNVFGPETRAVNESETESVITGPHEAFNESAGQSISLIRRRVRSSHLKTIRISVGEITKTDIYLLYIENIVNKDFVEMFNKRVGSIKIDGIFDSNMLIQMIEDNPYSIFPQYLTTERPDVAASKLIEGKIVAITDGSPTATVAPTSFFDFFNSPDDYYQRWALGSFLRLLRYIAFGITIFFTAFYVSLTTYHYEMIPRPLLLTLLESRSRVPFPPLLEALLMEITIELLREAGARLPTKIGQTIGIVGGIVIGQAAVEAGFTSNVLIISVAISAIASFVIPSYMMSASIRLVRFGIIILAGMWGNYGIMLGIALVLIHLTGITNMGTSYLTPITPLYPQDLKDVFIRSPFSMLKSRPVQSRTPNPIREKKKL
ncbi:spore germination protein [Bacillus sp. V59.32b]|uniref:spore germination protein n=1 Tax=Bacillus sp. V59.32b TaxID=1758642 RepID=UPI0020B15FD0|nr:spore germination protein [Bacillus sp. V59.32b]